jgi:hypothetical protein
MGGNQSTIDQESLTNIVVSSTIQVTQSEASNINQSNTIILDTNLSQKLTDDSRQKCLELGLKYSKDPTNDMDKITKNCILLYPEVILEGIKINGVLDVKKINTQIQALTQEQESDIIDKIKSSIKQTSSGITLGNNSDVTIKDFINENLSSLIQAIQTSVTDVNVDNQIVINGGGVRGILINSVTNDMVQNLQQNTNFQSNISKLTKDLEADVDQTSSLFGGFGKIILIIIICIVGFFIILFLIITLIKYSKKTNTKQVEVEMKTINREQSASQSKFNFKYPRYKKYVYK